jgi:DMSO/TMAO reductase YedYZ molybdopterin-dependent catalytic subunit
MTRKLSRRKFITRSVMTVGGAVTGLAVSGRIADRHGWLAPDHEGILGIGEALTYGSQRLLMASHSMAREFARSEISRVAPVNHRHPGYDPYQRLLYNSFADWRLYVDGMVAKPTALSLPDLKRLPARTQITQLICEEGWSYIAAWTGVPLSLILNLVGASSHARWVVFYPFDEFWGSIDIAEARHPQTLLAYAMNGEDLSADHGAPIRLRVPRQLGYKNLKFLARITVVDSLRDVGDGQGSAAPGIGYSWYAGI